MTSYEKYHIKLIEPIVNEMETKICIKKKAKPLLLHTKNVFSNSPRMQKLLSEWLLAFSGFCENLAKATLSAQNCVFPHNHEGVFVILDTWTPLKVH